MIVTHAEKNIENQKGGHHILRAEKYGWRQYEKQIQETINELIRLRQVLADGRCDGDKSKGGE